MCPVLEGAEFRPVLESWHHWMQTTSISLVVRRKGQLGAGLSPVAQGMPGEVGDPH